MQTTRFDQAQLFLLVDRDGANETSLWLPTDTLLTQWIGAALHVAAPDEWRAHNMEVSLSCVTSATIRELNAEYRAKDSATNVLSFPADMPLVPGLDADEKQTVVLGDVVVCAEVLTKEADAQLKSLEHHWAHMVVHSVLHLLGLDHQDENAAHTMESVEIQILSTLGIANPYLAVSANQS